MQLKLQQVIDYARTDADYAMFQKAFLLGLMNNERAKAEVLSLSLQGIRHHHMSHAIFERGRAYTVLENYPKGEADFNTIINTYQSSPLFRVPWYNSDFSITIWGRIRKPLKQYKKVIETYRATPEARSAMTG
jgi:tetratricopeptide (TPR) repeat protein